MIWKFEHEIIINQKDTVVPNSPRIIYPGSSISDHPPRIIHPGKED